MKKVIAVLIVVLILASCGGASDTYKCYLEVNKAFPNAIEIKRMPKKQYSFIVIDQDSSIYVIKTLNMTNPEISDSDFVYKFGQ